MNMKLVNIEDGGVFEPKWTDGERWTNDVRRDGTPDKRTNTKRIGVTVCGEGNRAWHYTARYATFIEEREALANQIRAKVTAAEDALEAAKLELAKFYFNTGK